MDTPRAVEPRHEPCCRGRSMHLRCRPCAPLLATALAALSACGDATSWAPYGAGDDSGGVGSSSGGNASSSGGSGGGQRDSSTSPTGDDGPVGMSGDDASSADGSDPGIGMSDGGWAPDSGLPTGSAYYVATDGSDSNSGTDVDHPFLTISKAASLVQAGGTVVIRAGVYRETVTPTRSGSSGSLITFQNYPGETVTLSGADVIPTSSWAVHSGSIYEAPMAWTLGNGMDQIFVDGVMMNEAREPNTTLDVSHPKASLVGSASVSGSSITVSDPALTQTAGFWNGAHVNMGSGKVWVYATYTVTSSSPGQFVFSGDASNANYAPTAGNPYYLWGTLNALDSAGECFHDATSNTLYLWTPQGDSPAGHLVEAKRRKYAFDFGGQSYIVVRGLRMFGATVTMNASSHDNVIDGVAARYVSHVMVLDGSFGANAGTTGFLIDGTNNTVENTAISFSSGNGVSVNGNGHTVTNCVIHDVDYVTSDCGAVYPQGGSGITVSHNTMYSGGRSLLLFRTITASKALNNLIYGAGLQAQDLGGIYTYGTDSAQSEIAYNVVHGVNPIYGGKGGEAIYLDNGSSNYVVHHNLGYDVSEDTMIINTVSTNNLIYNNTFDKGIHGGGTDPGVRIVNNIFLGAIKIGTGATTVTDNLVKPTDPKFVDAAAGNYQLQTGSPAIDKGMALPPYTDGYVGSAPDLGAFELGAPPWSAGASLTSDGF